jgi:hypothetical protein
MADRHIEFIQDILISIHENIRDLKERKTFADPDEVTYIDAKLMAYQEVLAIIQMSADEFNISKADIGI